MSDQGGTQAVDTETGGAERASGLEPQTPPGEVGPEAFWLKMCLQC